MQAKLPGGLTSVTKIIQLISLADVMLTNQALKYTNHTSAFYRQENTLTRQVPPKLSRAAALLLDLAYLILPRKRHILKSHRSQQPNSFPDISSISSLKKQFPMTH